MTTAHWIAVAAMAAVALASVVLIRVLRKHNQRSRRIAQSPDYPIYETLMPGETPILKECLGYRQGGCLVITYFGNLNKLPRLSDAPPKQ